MYVCGGVGVWACGDVDVGVGVGVGGWVGGRKGGWRGWGRFVLVQVWMCTGRKEEGDSGAPTYAPHCFSTCAWLRKGLWCGKPPRGVHKHTRTGGQLWRHFSPMESLGACLT